MLFPRTISLAIGAAAVVLLASLTFVGTGAQDATIAGDPVTVKLRNTGTTGGELNVGVQSDGDIFVGGWDAIARSRDDGETWTRHAVYPGFNIAADRVLIVDKDTDRVFVDDTDLVCTLLSWSDDDGDTWVNNLVACGGGATDHQKIGVGPRTALADPTGTLYPNIVYVCANSLTHTPCAASPLGGLGFGPGMPSMQFDAENVQVVTTCAFQGAPVSHSSGRVYQPRTQCGAALWWSDDNALTWTHSEPPVDASSDAPDVAVTPDRTVYFAYTDASFMPRVAVSPDGGESWSMDYSVAAPGVQTSAFPSIVAGDDGRIAVAYYGAVNAAGNPGGVGDSAKWQLYVNVITDAAGTPEHHHVQATPDSDPVQYGCISKLGGCLSNILDYEDIDVTPDGRFVAVYTDGCRGCSNASSSTFDDAWVAIQTGGPRLYAGA